jgi:integrase
VVGIDPGTDRATAAGAFGGLVGALQRPGRAITDATDQDAGRPDNDHGHQELAPLPLPDICLSAFTGRKAVQKTWKEKAGEAWQGRDLVFTTRHGSPIEPRNFHRDFKARCRKAGVRSVPVHTTRRTCASLLVAMDVHPRVVMQILRHSQIAVTMNVYSEVTSAETREALKRLGKSLEAE